MPEWFEELDAELAAHAATKGWNKPASELDLGAMVKAHFNAEKMIGVPADQLIRVPKDANDPNYASIYDRIVGMGAPKDAAAYDLSEVRFKDGSPIDEADANFVRGIAAELKLPVHAARVIAAKFADRASATLAEQAAGTETRKAANHAAIRSLWGTEHDQKAFSAQRAAEAVGFPADVISHMVELPAEKYIASMEALVKLGQQMNEAAMLRGGRGAADPTASMTADQARDRIEELKTDQRWLAQFGAGDVEAHRLFDKLTRIMAGAPPAQAA